MRSPTNLKLPDFFILLALLHTSCTGSAPEIVDVVYQINIVKDRELGATYQQLSLFITADDQDGFEDLDTIFLIQDKEELFWTLDNLSWQRIQEGQQNWIGSNSFTMPDNSDLPEGKYRIVLKDLSGEKAESHFFLEPASVKQEELRFPELTVEEGILRVRNAQGGAEILVYEGGAILANRFEATEDGIPLTTVREAVGGGYSSISLYVYLYNDSLQVGLVTGPYFP